MSRRRDRRHTFQLVFQIEFHTAEEMDECKALFFQTLEDAENLDQAFVEAAFLGVLQNKEKIDGLINQYAEGWGIDRIAKSDLAIIRLCVYELLFRPEIPRSVAINEAVELAKLFSTDEGPAFVNGVLAKITANL
ncbi:MAG: transcription antitermination factor NusB [Clostridiales bacterium]|jgi:N utilization substance protein B|nr:transcription antitermination factor NusB [Clostridiales bacterium]